MSRFQNMAKNLQKKKKETSKEIKKLRNVVGNAET